VLVNGGFFPQGSGNGLVGGGGSLDSTTTDVKCTITYKAFIFLHGRADIKTLAAYYTEDTAEIARLVTRLAIIVFSHFPYQVVASLASSTLSSKHPINDLVIIILLIHSQAKSPGIAVIASRTNAGKKSYNTWGLGLINNYYQGL
jgi:hypothetical protein